MIKWPIVHYKAKRVGVLFVNDLLEREVNRIHQLKYSCNGFIQVGSINQLHYIPTKPTHPVIIRVDNTVHLTIHEC